MYIQYNIIVNAYYVRRYMLDPTSSTGDPQPMVSTGQPPSPTSAKPSSRTVNLPSQSVQGTSTKLATGLPLSFSAAYLPSDPASEPSAVTRVQQHQMVLVLLNHLFSLMTSYLVLLPSS